MSLGRTRAEASFVIASMVALVGACSLAGSAGDDAVIVVVAGPVSLALAVSIATKVASMMAMIATRFTVNVAMALPVEEPLIDLSVMNGMSVRVSKSLV